MGRLKYTLGTVLLFLIMLAVAWSLTKWPMGWDRALLITALMELSHMSRSQDEKSPLRKSEKP